MKNKNIIGKLSLMILLLTLFSTFNCRKTSNGTAQLQQTGLVRIIDQIKPENVLASPFKDILQYFQTIEEDITGKLINFPELSTSQQRVLAATSTYSILGQSDLEKPQHMDVLLNGNPMAFLNGGDENSIRWKWIKTNRDIDFRYDENFNKRLQYLFLEENESFTFETILPDAPVEFQVLARRNWHPIDLEIYVNDKLLNKKAVSRNSKLFKFKKRHLIGTNKITVKATISERVKDKTRGTPPRLLINLIRVNTKNDVILFFVPSNLQNEIQNNSITTKYLSDRDKAGNENPYFKLFKMKNQYSLDEYDQKFNPENIKKKINLENLSLDVLMAPPESRFEFQTTVLSGSFLEFGFGIYAENVFEGPYKNRFKIIVENGDKQNIIFDKEFELLPENIKDQLVFEKIDLTDYQDKKVKFTFLTENLEDNQRTNNEQNNTFAFWANPIISKPIENKNKPNIILISLDTLRADHLGGYGYEKNTSPNMDNLLKESVMFENVFAHSSWTLPSHLSMLFSLNSASHQVYYNTQKIDNSIPSIASFLREEGYITYGFTGGGYVSSMFGFAKGFDWYDEPVGGRNAPLADDESERLFEYTGEWLRKNQDKKFFLFLHTFQIHGPYKCPEPWNETFLAEDAEWKGIGLRNLLLEKGQDFPFTPEQRENIKALYDGEIKYTDETLIKPIIDLLKELNLYENTLLIITSDHGEEFFEHQGWLHSRTLYNELIRVPLIIKFPQSQYKGTKINPIVRLIDIMPTILETSSIKYEKNNLEGKSLLDVITGKEKTDRTFISDIAFKDVFDPCPALIATNKDRIKFIFEKSPDGLKDVETYDLDRDPTEHSKSLFQKVVKIRSDILAFIDKYYIEKKKIQRKKNEVHLDEKMKEKLRALGYLH